MRRSSTQHARRMINRSTAEILAGIDGVIESAGIVRATGPSYYLHEPVRVRLLRWSWRISDQAPSPHEVVLAGRARTRRGAFKARYRAYKRLLDGAA